VNARAEGWFRIGAGHSLSISPGGAFSTISELLGSSNLLRVEGSFGVAVWPQSETIFYPTLADLGF
jgi:hypothetical protein